MLALMRGLTYAAVFVGLVLVLLPARLLSWTGVATPQTLGIPQVAGIVVAVAGGSLALWCVLTFALIGRGTPAPFDPPRRLVVRGPYRFVRNPMYMGATLALVGGALYFTSMTLLGFAALFALGTHIFAVSYEEPALRRMFGEEYRAYCRRVSRWRPRRPGGRDGG